MKNPSTHYWKQVFLFPILVLLSAALHAQFGTSPWTAPSGTYTVPTGVTSLTVTCYGGGGGGGGVKTSVGDDADGGGGGGGACSVTTFSVTPGQSIIVSVGAGGTAGTTTPTAGGAGGASTVKIGATTMASANGGGGGGSSTGTVGAGGTGATAGTGTVHSGGNGGAGAFNTSFDWAGSGGGGGGTTANGGNGSNSANPPLGGAGGATGGGAGGNGVRTASSGAGTVGSTYGGGGGGACAFSTGVVSVAGKAGAAGAVIITYTVVTCTQPTAFSVTGGGAYCSGGSGVAVGVANSQSGGNFSYQLKLNGSNTGSPLIGTGSAISFGNQTSAGTYTVECTNTSTSCVNTMTGSVSVTVYANNLAASATATNQTTCNNGTGAVTLTPSGGSGSYTYLWSNSATTQNLSSLQSGTYTVTVTDATCPAFTKPSASATVTAPWTAGASAGTTGCTTQITATPATTNTTIFSDNFESYTGGIIDGSASPWREAYISGGAFTYWYVGNCSPVTGTKSLTLYDDWWGTTCDYDADDFMEDIAYYVTKVNATSYTNLKMNFKWKGTGESGFDYGQVAYSTDAGTPTNWNILPTQYAGASTNQTVSNLDLSALNGQSFYIGFLWSNDDSYNGGAFAVDDISITGDVAPAYSWSGPVGASYNASNTVRAPFVDKAGTYTVAVTQSGCTSTASVAVSVSAQSTAPTSITGTTTVCGGGSTTLTTNGGSLGAGATDIWFATSATEIFDQSWSTQPYSTPNTTVNSFANGILNVTSTNNDPMIDMTGLGSFSPSTYKNIHIRYRVTAGTGGVAEIFFYNTSHGGAVGGESATGALVSDGAWHVLNIDMTQDPDYTTGGNITGWRFDWSSNSGVTMDIDFIGLGDGVIIADGTSATVSPVATTTYYTKKKGACNNTSDISQAVTISGSPTASVGYVSCPGMNGNTTVQIAASGSTGPYTYKLNTGSFTSADKFSIANGSNQNYYVKDNAGCISGVLNYTAPYVTPTAIASSTTTATGCSCKNENRDVYLTNGSDVVLVINDNNNDLGTVTATMYQHGSPVMVTGTHGTGQEAALQRNWVVNASTQPSTPITLKFPYIASELTALQASAATTSTSADNITSAADLKATRYKGPNEDDVYYTPGYTVLQVLSQSGSGNILGSPYVAFNTPGTSEYWLHGDANGAALPVTLISFTATPINDSYIHLDWLTASEINNKGFELQRSTNGSEFDAIGWTDGNGSSNEQHAYGSDDKTAEPNVIYYYRLKQVDVDGITSYSNIVSASIIEGKNGFTIESLRPNPAADKVTISVASVGDQNTTIEITDVLGRMVHSQSWSIQDGFNNLDIDTKALGTGSYSVVLKTGNEYFTKKLVIAR